MIEEGVIHSVIGGDGAGKSTLLRVLAGLDVGQTGTVRLPAPARIGFVPSAGGIFGDLTVLENLEFVADAYRLRGWRPRADMLLDRMALDTLVDRIAGRMSGGQRRKLAGIMALLSQPDLVVLDELTTGIDPVSRMELWRLIAGAATGGAAVDRVDVVPRRSRTGRVGPAAAPRSHAARAGTRDRSRRPSRARSPKSCATPSDRRLAWRRGRAWRQWDPERTDGGDRVTLEDRGDRLRTHPESATPMNPVDATDVTRTFGALTAVDGVSISVRSGEVVGLLGANGAGKTTLIKMILGLLRPTAGRILLFGRPQARELRARIGYVPQDLEL